MQITRDQIDPDAAKVVQRLRDYNYTAYLVGGCVRDLLLGRKPKDFDVATSAKPNELRRLFRNCRIIGRRFRLAHIFFGPKVIETSTFRSNPREGEDDGPDAPEGADAPDLLIRRDNVFGTVEEDARRRDFTINGLFFDIESGQVIDHVGGMADLDARLIRTIGDPDIRLREDPVRILRAVKFAARCDLTIEPETYRHMLGHAGEIAKCAQARVSEEFYRLLRAGAARRSVEMLAETGLLDVLNPEMAATLRASTDEAIRLTQARFWAYLAALDAASGRRSTPPSNALLLATLLLPALRDALDPDARSVPDIGQLVTRATQPVFERLKSSRRDSELARQILLAMRYVMPSQNPNRRRPRLSGREFFADTVRLGELVGDAERASPEIAPRLAAGDALTPDTAPEADDELPPELQPPPERAPRAYQPPPSRGGPAPSWVATPPTPIPAPDVPAGAESRPRFLGTGAFGRWGAASD